MEKIKILILIIVFIFLLIICNKILRNEENKIIINDTVNNLGVETISNIDKQNYNYEEDNMSKNVLELTNENFEKEVLECENTVLIDFYADWCGPCKMLSPIIEEVATEEKDVKFVKINVDEMQEIASKYQVVSIPTLVVVRNGEIINRSVGLIDKNKVKDLIK